MTIIKLELWPLYPLCTKCHYHVWVLYEPAFYIRRFA
jgi:hypothetical protein